MGANTFECSWFYSGNREEETYYAGRSRTIIEFRKNNGKRRIVMTRCDWKACGPITHRSKIAKTVEAAMFPRPEKDMSSMEWQHQQQFGQGWNPFEVQCVRSTLDPCKVRTQCHRSRLKAR